ncbi:hypothetical protein AVEN_30418-1 [Araneus ventricosus]|uniref:Uncharacterized protein n=1 Tax=Araneus ventricosus TaxID=182803 RepID=A0A4Y2NSK1_ARAVE|nr:hypothetical protein AVEN_30418-1 [Araneus ventricosus]
MDFSCKNITILVITGLFFDVSVVQSSEGYHEKEQNEGSRFFRSEPSRGGGDASTCCSDNLWKIEQSHLCGCPIPVEIRLFSLLMNGLLNKLYCTAVRGQCSRIRQQENT